MRVTLLVAARDLRSRLLDRSALFVGVIGPVALALIISFATGGGSESFRADVGVVDLDGGEIAAAFIDEVLGSDGVQDVFTVEKLATREAAEASVARRALSAAFIIEADLEGITVLRSPSARIAGEIATSIAETFAANVAGVSQAIGLSVMVSILGPDAFSEEGIRPPTGSAFGSFDVGPLDVDADDIEALASEVIDAPLPIALVDASTGSSGLTTASYFGPGMAMLFVFFLLGAAPRSLIAESEGGTLARLRAAPVSIVSIIAGKGLSVAVLGLTSMCVVWAVTAVVFGASWGDPIAVLALLVAFVVAALGITTLVSVYARTESQADGFVTIVAFLMAMLGGNFLFLGDLPPLLQRIALWTPNGWALQGFTTLTSDGGGVVDILGPIGAVLLFAVATFVAAVPGLRRWTVA